MCPRYRTLNKQVSPSSHFEVKGTRYTEGLKEEILIPIFSPSSQLNLINLIEKGHKEMLSCLISLWPKELTATPNGQEQ